MAIVDIFDLMAQVAMTSDAPGDDQTLLVGKIDAAQNHIERLLGFKIEEEFGGAGQDPVPPALCEAVMQLAAWWFENREAGGDASRPMPFGVDEIVAEYREYTF
jgi:hypothetical protein